MLTKLLKHTSGIELEWTCIKLPFVLSCFYILRRALFETSSISFNRGICSLFNCELLVIHAVKMGIIAVFILLALFYILEKKMMVVTGLMFVLCLIVFSAHESFGVQDRTGIITLIWLVQSVAYLWKWKNPNFDLKKNRIHFPIQVIVACYTLAGLSKIYHSGWLWISDNQYMTLQMIKTNQVSILDGISVQNRFLENKIAFVMQNPALISLLFFMALFIEVSSSLALLNKKTRIIYGILLLCLHLGIAYFFGIVIDSFFETMLIFLLNPFYLVLQLGAKLFWFQKKMVISLVLLSVIVSCSPTIISNEKQRIELKSNSFQLSNDVDSTVHFSLNINDKFPVDYSIISNVIAENQTKFSISKQEAAWKYVMENTYHADPFTSESWQHHPFIFLNSIGGGYCDDRASVLAKIWQFQGDSSRVIGLEGHVVPEVYTENAWHMFDPDYGVYFCDSTGVILSVDRIAASDEDISKMSCVDTVINPIFSAQNPISLKLLEMYKSQDNNEDISNWHLNYSGIRMNFSLPSYSNLCFMYNAELNIVNCAVNLSPRSKGRLTLPLVPFSVTGNIALSSGDTTFKISGSDQLFPRSEVYNSLVINEVTTHTTINYLMNPKLDIFDKSNFLEINTSGELKVHKNVQLSNEPHVLYGEFQWFFDQKTREHQASLRRLSQFGNPKLNEEFIKEQFDYFLEMDRSLNQKERLNSRIQFDQDYMSLVNTLSVKQQNFIKEHYPTSIFYLFLALRYRRMDDIVHFINQHE